MNLAVDVSILLCVYMFFCKRTGDSHPKEKEGRRERWMVCRRTYQEAHMEPARAHVGDLEAFGMEHMTRYKHAHTQNARTVLHVGRLCCVYYTDTALSARVRQERCSTRQTAGCANCGCEPDDYKSEASTLLRSSCICSTDTRTHSVRLVSVSPYQPEHVTHRLSAI